MTLSTRTHRFRLRLSIPLLACLVVVCSACSQPGAEANPVAATSTIQNKGSDTLVNVALAWAEAYMAQHTQIRISVTGGGSGTGFTALINGTADLANASREITPQEVAQAKAAGFEPVQHVVARDAIAVIVHPSNPVKGLTIDQLSDIFTQKITRWSQVGGEDRPIVLLSRESNSGTYVYFLENVVRKGDAKAAVYFSPDTLLMPSSEGITAEVRQNPNAIGYDGLGYVTPEVKTVPVAAAAGKPFVEPGIDSVNAGSYPIARPLFVYSRGQPQGELKDYLDWILSREGQVIVGKLGFVPLQ